VLRLRTARCAAFSTPTLQRPGTITLIEEYTMFPARLAALLSLAGLSACTLHLDRDTNISREQRIDNVYQVDGAINLAQGAKGGNLSGVSSSINLQEGAQADQLRTVDGAINLAERASVGGDVRSVDGPITLARGAHVLGNVQTLSSSITLAGAVVAGGLETVSGTIHIGGGSLVNHDIVLSKPSSHQSGDDIQRLPTVIIAPDAKVLGQVVAERGAVIWISRSAQVGAVHGAQVHWYEGATPPPA
jgi:carbonic anhydrase/acetyltransferase-like protein (isoleucine patch superfamily)